MALCFCHTQHTVYRRRPWKELGDYLRDGLIVAAASVAAEEHRASVLEREYIPNNWKGRKVDIVVQSGTSSSPKIITAVELKWWRRDDGGNSSNRRREIVVDFLRMAALAPCVEVAGFVALLSTMSSWQKTTGTTCTDKAVMDLIKSAGVQRWDVRGMRNCAAIRAAISELSGQVPICNIFYSELLSIHALTQSKQTIAVAHVWRIHKRQNSKFLKDDVVEKLVERKK
ncbi:hypothetical protein HS125_05610 [bacterium]|nr:hypothetical protein [bacterium]